MTELSDAIAARTDQIVALTPSERAAAETDLHLATCDAVQLGDCADCLHKLARIRRYLEAAGPVLRDEGAAAMAHVLVQALETEATAMEQQGSQVGLAWIREAAAILRRTAGIGNHNEGNRV